MGFRRRQKSTSTASSRSRAAPAAEPATDPGGQRLENLRIDRRQDQNRRLRRAKAATWDATGCLRRAKKACHRRYIPCSLPFLLSALISSGFFLIFPDFVISSIRPATKRPKRSCCFCSSI